MADPLRPAPQRGPAQPRAPWWRWALATGLLALAGCGGSDDGSSSLPPTTPTTTPPTTPPASTLSTPLAWDAAQATWDNVVWQ